ncbi:MAG: serine O-acetyltransferase EpsC [Thermodesulfobacteriota bacterium]
MQQERDPLGCKPEADTAERLAQEIPGIVNDLVATCHTQGCFSHVSPVPIPSRRAVIAIVEQGRRILFPGYYSNERLDGVNLPYHLGREVTELYEDLARQITWAIRHDCYRYDQECSLCEDQGRQKALEFVRALPGLRRTLASDVRAAYEGDPASASHDEIIFSYPGLMAITVYRLAHALYHLDVPLLPRIMTEYAHGRTGIDIHPGAHIGESFFIDHGTGVVIGQTAEIGDRVRIYQGVTLGALSLPRDANDALREKKRHPTIEDDVTIYAGATILGGQTVVGAGAVIGGNVWLTESVPPGTKVFIKKPELVYVDRR